MRYEHNEIEVVGIELRKPTEESKVVAIVAIALQKIYLIRGIEIVQVEHENQKALAVVMPHTLSENIFDCATKDGRLYVRMTVLGAYADKLRKEALHDDCKKIVRE